MEVKNMNYKKMLFLGIMLASCGPLMAVQETFAFRVKASDKSNMIFIKLYDTKGACAGEAYYSVANNSKDSEDAEWLEWLWVNPLYQKTSMGKFLVMCVLADIITRHPDTRMVSWLAASTHGYMSDVELMEYYARIGGVCYDKNSGYFRLDLDAMRKQNTLFDFRKISDFIRSGATFSFDLSKKEEGQKIDGDGKAVLRSRL